MFEIYKRRYQSVPSAGDLTKMTTAGPSQLASERCSVTNASGRRFPRIYAFTCESCCMIRAASIYETSSLTAWQRVHCSIAGSEIGWCT